MANAGKNTNGSQFFLTLRPCPHLDGRHVVFGELESGMALLRRMESVETDSRDKPTTFEQVVINDCGEVRDEPPKRKRDDDSDDDERKERKARKKAEKKEKKRLKKEKKKEKKREKKEKKREKERGDRSD